MTKAKDRRLHDWAADIRQAAQNVKEDIGALSMSQFIADGKTLRAVATSLSNIGEASNRIMGMAPTLEQSNPKLHEQLRGAYLMRNFLQHGYFTTDASLVWNTVSTYLPALTEMLGADATFTTPASGEPLKPNAKRRRP